MTHHQYLERFLLRNTEERPRPAFACSPAQKAAGDQRSFRAQESAGNPRFLDDRLVLRNGPAHQVPVAAPLRTAEREEKGKMLLVSTMVCRLVALLASWSAYRYGSTRHLQRAIVKERSTGLALPFTTKVSADCGKNKFMICIAFAQKRRGFLAARNHPRQRLWRGEHEKQKDG